MSAIKLNNFGADQKASVYKDQIVPLHSNEIAISQVYQYQMKFGDTIINTVFTWVGQVKSKPPLVGLMITPKQLMCTWGTSSFLKGPATLHKYSCITSEWSWEEFMFLLAEWCILETNAEALWYTLNKKLTRAGDGWALYKYNQVDWINGVTMLQVMLGTDNEHASPAVWVIHLDSQCVSVKTLVLVSWSATGLYEPTSHSK